MRLQMRFSIAFGAILALLSVYSARLWHLLVNLPRDPTTQRFAAGIVLAFLPAAVLGATFHDVITRVFFQSVVLISLALVLGGALGGVMGVVFGAFEPMEVPAPDAPKVTMRETIRQGAKSAGARSWSYAKGFAAFGALYAGSECVVEKVRAKHDVANSAYAGCFTGGVMARTSGPTGMAVGCATMAALSVAMDKFMDHH